MAILARTAVSLRGVQAITSLGSGMNPASHANPFDLAGTEMSGELDTGVCVEPLAHILQALRQLEMPGPSLVRQGPLAVLRCNIQAELQCPYPKADAAAMHLWRFYSSLCTNEFHVSRTIYCDIRYTVDYKIGCNWACCSLTQ